MQNVLRLAQITTQATRAIAAAAASSLGRSRHSYYTQFSKFFTTAAFEIMGGKQTRLPYTIKIRTVALLKIFSKFYAV